MRAQSLSAASFVVIGMLSLVPSAVAQTNPQISAALAQLTGTIRVYFQPMITQGELVGCTLVFDALHQDHTYSQGRYVKVSGNVGILGMQGTLGATVKVVLNDLDPESMSQQPTSSPPTRAYLVGDGYTTNLASLVQASPSDVPGALFSVFQLEPTFQIVMSALESRSLTVAFNRGKGATDILLPIEIDVADVNASGFRRRSSEASDDFTECLGALLQSMQSDTP